MRKKSHISLAWYLMNSEGMESIQRHRGLFYIGSVLPDCLPSFYSKKTYDGRFLWRSGERTQKDGITL